jgi:hypothetical protein
MSSLIAFKSALEQRIVNPELVNKSAKLAESACRYLSQLDPAEVSSKEDSDKLLRVVSFVKAMYKVITGETDPYRLPQVLRLMDGLDIKSSVLIEHVDARAAKKQREKSALPFLGIEKGLDVELKKALPWVRYTPRQKAADFSSTRTKSSLDKLLDRIESKATDNYTLYALCFISFLRRYPLFDINIHESMSGLSRDERIILHTKEYKKEHVKRVNANVNYVHIFETELAKSDFFKQSVLSGQIVRAQFRAFLSDYFKEEAALGYPARFIPDVEHEDLAPTTRMTSTHQRQFSLVYSAFAREIRSVYHEVHTPSKIPTLVLGMWGKTLAYANKLSFASVVRSIEQMSKHVSYSVAVDIAIMIAFKFGSVKLQSISNDGLANYLVELVKDHEWMIKNIDAFCKAVVVLAASVTVVLSTMSTSLFIKNLGTQLSSKYVVFGGYSLFAAYSVFSLTSTVVSAANSMFLDYKHGITVAVPILYYSVTMLMNLKPDTLHEFFRVLTWQRRQDKAVANGGAIDWKNSSGIMPYVQITGTNTAVMYLANSLLGASGDTATRMLEISCVATVSEMYVNRLKRKRDPLGGEETEDEENVLKRKMVSPAVIPVAACMSVKEDLLGEIAFYGLFTGAVRKISPHVQAVAEKNRSIEAYVEKCIANTAETIDIKTVQSSSWKDIETLVQIARDTLHVAIQTGHFLKKKIKM